uniref:Retinitis pigmentosa 9 protein n=1 Tax=Anser cygnoides TaxID=8845 RepID=A0A8B9DK77_ANSCY
MGGECFNSILLKYCVLSISLFMLSYRVTIFILLFSYEKPPPGLIKENETKPEDCIPDVPGNESAREFLAHAPTKGLWMPLGKEVKVMQCWRCKRYGHRTGDKECPFFIKGNQKLEQFRVAHEDPMYDIIRETKRHEKEMRYVSL